MSGRKKVKIDTQVMRADAGPPACPFCKATITNYMTIFYNRKYSCTQCHGKYFLIKISDIMYTQFAGLST